jgi:hypothetical protein
MNKTLKIFLIALSVLVFLSVGNFLYMAFGPKPAVEQVLPSGAIVYGRLLHPAKHWQNGAQSEFWKNVSSIDLPLVLERNHVPKAAITQVKYWQEKSAEFLNNPMTEKFLGKEIAFAVYRRKEFDAVKDPEKAYGSLMVIRLSPSVQMAESLSRLASQWGEKISTHEENYQGKSIIEVHFKENNASFKYVRYKDLLIVAPEGDRELKAAIDGIVTRTKSLAQDEQFNFAKSYGYSGGEGLFYLNARAFYEVFKDEEWGEDAFSHIAGFRSYILSFLPGEVLKYKFVIGIEPKLIRPALRRIINCVPMANPSLNFIPPNVIGYQWSGCYDFKETWQQAKEELYSLPDEAAEQARKIKKGIERRGGFKFGDDLLPVLGEEAGGYFTDIDTLGMAPYPRFLVFVKIKDRLKAQEVFSRLKNTPFGPLQEEEYSKENIRYFSLPLGANMDPAYCFLGDYFLAASSRQLLKKSIDTFHDPANSIISDKVFKSLDLTQKAQSVAFLKLGELALRLHKLVDWGNRYLSSQVNGAPAYKLEAEERQKEFVLEIAKREADLKMASTKLVELKEKPVSDPDEKEIIDGTIEHLKQDIENLRDEIKTYTIHQKELDYMILHHEEQVESAKLMMFNSQQVIVPFLKGLETIQAQGTRVTVGPKAIEAEFLFN